jgi:S-methylmethionine-dependent homocysteine/selenocysteine methylase
MNKILENEPLVLMEGAVVEPLRRAGKVRLHQTLVNAPLIYKEAERAELGKIYQEYIDISLSAELPFLMCTPTWRANRARVDRSNVNPSVNVDAVHFLQDIRRTRQSDNGMIKIGGMIGCKNDCYQPNEGLSAAESEKFHSWQIDQLAKTDVDFLIAVTLPNAEEAKGMAKAMEKTGLPYIISFVIARNGRIPDGTDLSVAIDTIDSATDRKPLGFMVNCAYPTFLCAADQPSTLFKRLIGYQGNASSLDHCDLDGADRLEAENVSDWGDAMLTLNRSYGITILGGCCGTGSEHLRYISQRSR